MTLYFESSFLPLLNAGILSVCYHAPFPLISRMRRKSAQVVFDHKGRPKLRKIPGRHHRCQVSVTAVMCNSSLALQWWGTIQERHSFVIAHCDRTMGLAGSKHTKLKALR